MAMRWIAYRGIVDPSNGPATGALPANRIDGDRPLDIQTTDAGYGDPRGRESASVDSRGPTCFTEDATHKIHWKTRENHP